MYLGVSVHRFGIFFDFCKMERWSHHPTDFKPMLVSWSQQQSSSQPLFKEHIISTFIEFGVAACNYLKTILVIKKRFRICASASKIQLSTTPSKTIYLHGFAVQRYHNQLGPDPQLYDRLPLIQCFVHFVQHKTDYLLGLLWKFVHAANDW